VFESGVPLDEIIKISKRGWSTLSERGEPPIMYRRTKNYTEGRV